MENKQLEKDLTEALELQQFVIYYQPKLELASGKITGVEALIRWDHPEKGLLTPTQFIALAEGTNLISSIGEWVLRTACTQSKAWQDAGVPPLIIAVNLSVRQLYQPDFVENVERVLRETRLVPSYLELEITEYMTIDIFHILPILRRLKHIGVRISLDDFGIGYSSLFNFKELPIDIIKIDQSFVSNCIVDLKDAAIVKAIIALAHELNVEVVAEGIESKEQLIFLQQNLCDKGQGYLFSKPVPTTELLAAFHQIEKIISRDGIPSALCKQKWLQDALHKTQQELADTLRNQQGMTFKFRRQDDRFIHTLCDGELVYRIGLTPEQIVGNELMDFRSLADAERKLQYYQRAWNGEDYVTYEAESNGVWYLASLRPIRRGGQVVEVIGSCVDITERIRKEQELSILTEHLTDKERKYRLLADNSDDFIVLLSPNGLVRYASPSHERLLCIPTNGTDGQPGFQRFHPDDIVRVKQLFRSAVEKKSTVNFECRYGRTEASYIWVEATMSPILSPDGEVEYILGVGHDITERKVQEEKLRQSEQRYRELVELSPDAIFVHIDGRIVYANQSSVKLLAVKCVNDLIGRSLLDFMHPEDRKSALNRIAHGMSAEGNSCGLIEARYIRFDGNEIDIESKGVGILYGDEHAIQLLVRDITARKETERTTAEERAKLDPMFNNSQDTINRC